MKQTKLLFFKKLITRWSMSVFVLLAYATAGHGQQLVSTGGGYFSGASGSISWSVGELIVATFANENTALTQGFHQTYTWGVFVNELETEEHFFTYPNPAKDHFYVVSPYAEGQSYDYILMDFTGKMVARGTLQNSPERISMSGLQSSVYFLRITEKNRHVKTLRIIK